MPSSRFVRRTVLVLALLQVAVFDLDAREDWAVLENCRFIPNPADDGDSFHASVGSVEYIFRLCLIDAPETAATDPARLIEQAKYFEITVPQAIEVGEAATVFTREKLTEPFTVFTRMSGAPGRSRIERLYAFVQTSEGDLGEQLVRNGFARVHGLKVIPPGLASAKPELEKLQQLEDEARQEKIGGWGLNQDRLNVRASKQTPLSFSVFVLPDKVTPPPVPAPASAAPTPARSTPKEIATAKLDINVASLAELESIPGIGPALANRILAARPFKTADDLRKVEGIGATRYGKLRPYFE